MEARQINDLLRGRLEKMKQKIVERGENKPTSFQLMDALMNEFDAVEELDKCKELLKIYSNYDLALQYAQVRINSYENFLNENGFPIFQPAEPEIRRILKGDSE